MYLINLLTGMGPNINLNHPHPVVVRSGFLEVVKAHITKKFSIGEKMIREFVRKHRLSQTLEDAIN